MMKDAILGFNKQFDFKPVVQNSKKLKTYLSFAVCGMGGSNLAAGLLRAWQPSFDIIVHRDYGLPHLSKRDMSERLFIFSSYSGNTEEVLDGYAQARKQKLHMAVIAAGGALVARAKKDGVPYVEMPNTGIQPRSALGLNVVGLLALMKNTSGARAAKTLSARLRPETWRGAGKALAKKLFDTVPVVYASARNEAIAYNWKIKLNETGKIPAFYNVLPELNHNEMTGFDVVPMSRHLSDRFAFLFLEDADDHPKVIKRMNVLKKMYAKRGLPVYSVPMKGARGFEKIFTSLLLADWTALALAEHYGLESEAVPMVEEFKGLIR